MDQLVISDCRDGLRRYAVRVRWLTQLHILLKISPTVTGIGRANAPRILWNTDSHPLWRLTLVPQRNGNYAYMNRHDLTLPIDLRGGLRMDPQEARATGFLFAADYAQAHPFCHIVLDGFLPPEVLQLAVSNFPRESLKSDRIFEINYGGHHKRQILPYDCGEQAQALFHFMNSHAVLQFLEGLTGIDGLIPDPYFEGGGFHEISTGGLLGVHADFRIHERLHLQRRLNLLIYLNSDWKDEWGGRLELWDRKMTKCEAKISPIMNRCVVFNTDAESFHGHPDPLATPDSVKRRSIALYYYTGSRAVYEEVPNHSTMYYARPADSAATQREARRFRVDEHLKDWLPPKLSRLVFKIRHKLSHRSNRR